MKFPLRSSASSAVNKRSAAIGPRIPSFADEEAVATFFETHDTSRIWEKMQPAVSLKLPLEQAKAMRERYVERKLSQILGLNGRQIARSRAIAQQKSVAVETQLKRWIAEGIRRESRGVRS